LTIGRCVPDFGILDGKEQNTSISMVGGDSIRDDEGKEIIADGVYKAIQYLTDLLNLRGLAEKVNFLYLVKLKQARFSRLISSTACTRLSSISRTCSTCVDWRKRLNFLYLVKLKQARFSRLFSPTACKRLSSISRTCSTCADWRKRLKFLYLVKLK
jgi:hypothetical protein